MRILHAGNHQLRKYGYTRVSWTQKLFFGLIRNNHCVQPFSDRDVASHEAPLRIRELGKNATNKRLIQTAEAFEPDLLFVGHCDIIKNETLEKIRQLLPNVIIAGGNADPLFVPKNYKKIMHRCAVLDLMFVTTGVKELTPFEGQRAKLFHMPNPVDSSIETFDVTLNTQFDNDVLFCSKADDNSTRGKTVSYVNEHLEKNIRFSTPGNFGQAGVWGRDYDHLLNKTKMGLNLNRQEGYHWYSSDRMVQLAANGVLTFTHADAEFNTMFPEETLVYFKSDEELVRAISEFHHDDDKRISWASKAREFSHREMNSTLFAQYVVEASTQKTYSHDYVWLDER